jgi:hypothetical protein
VVLGDDDRVPGRFESWVERDHLVTLDFVPSVIRTVSQPFYLLRPGPVREAMGR